MMYMTHVPGVDDPDEWIEFEGESFEDVARKLYDEVIEDPVEVWIKDKSEIRKFLVFSADPTVEELPA